VGARSRRVVHLAAGGIGAERHHDARLRDVHAVDQQGHEIQGVEDDRPPRLELRGRRRDEPVAHSVTVQGVGPFLSSEATV